MIKLIQNEVDLLHKVIAGYTKQKIREKSEATSYYQDDHVDNIEQELVEVYNLVVKLYANIEVESDNQ